MKTVLENFKRLSAKDYNKIVSYVEKEFTWDNEIKDKESCYFINREKQAKIFIFRGSANHWSTLNIEVKGKRIFRKNITSFEYVNLFKNMIRALEA